MNPEDAHRSPTATSRGHPTTKGERTRRRILDAAVTHFAATGFDGASVPEIARAVGMSHSALYQHFGRKEQLFCAAVDADLRALIEHAVPDGADLGDPEVLGRQTLALLDASAEHPLARRVLADLDREQATLLRDLSTLEALEDRVRSGVRQGQLDARVRTDLDADALAEGLVALSIALISMGIRLEGSDYPRATTAVNFLTEVLRPDRAAATLPDTTIEQ